jgi:iron complex transport system permease protein
MHLDYTQFPKEYKKLSYTKIKRIFFIFVLLLLLFFFALSTGPVLIPLNDIIKSLFKMGGTVKTNTVIQNIRLLRILTAILAGAGLSVSGLVIQSILKNPLGSPFTLGLSHAAAFGAAFSVMILGSGVMRSTLGDAVKISSPFLTSSSAFVFCLGATVLILYLSGLRQSRPEVITLAGVALGSLFTAATMLLQYFADDVQLSAMVFWTFGDVSRASWAELIYIFWTFFFCFIFFYHNRWNYNALFAGDETAMGLGVSVKFVRVTGLVAAAVLTSVIISFLGVIGFAGLICPHISRKIVGSDHCYLIPFSAVSGGFLLLAADTLGRTVMPGHTLPVAVLTSFLGAPVFFYLLVRGSRI